MLNSIALAGWLLLIFLPRWRWTATVVPLLAVPLLSAVYAVLAAAALPGSEGGFSSLAGVRALFADPWVLLAGWTHYLAFDLFIGSWQVRDAQRRGVPHLLVVPALVTHVPARAGGPAALSRDSMADAGQSGDGHRGRADDLIVRGVSP